MTWRFRLRAIGCPCSDDRVDGDLNPEIVFFNPLAVPYDIWVGPYEDPDTLDGFPDVTLRVSEIQKYSNDYVYINIEIAFIIFYLCFYRILTIKLHASTDCRIHNNPNSRSGCESCHSSFTGLA